MKDIIIFVNNFKKGFNVEETEKLFTQGNCYHFAIILHNIFRFTEIVHDNIDNHFMVRYEGIYYDITGIVEGVVDDKISTITELENEDPLYFSRLMRDCAYLKTK